MNIVAMVLVYNEGALLQRWIRHYGKHLGQQNLLILDHGSDDGSTADLGSIPHIRLVRDRGYDDIVRIEFAALLQASLLKFYDVVVYSDCDEFLIPDPRKFATLKEYIAQTTADCIRPVGLDLVHNRPQEPPLQDDGPVLTHRRYCKLMSALCKPIITRVPIRWAVGFHACNLPAQVDPDLFLVHLKYADYDAAMQRVEITRNLQWTERAIEAGWGKRHRASDDELTRTYFDVPAARIARNGAIPLDPQAAADKFNQSLVQAHGLWRCEPPIGGTLYEVPEWLRTSL